MRIESKIPDVGTSIFTVMSKMALDYDAINLSQGFPDFMIDDVIIELVHRYMREGYNQYAPMPGTPELRNVIAEVVQSSFGRRVDPDTEITITSGATESIFSVISAFVTTGDEVIMFDPSYDSYDPAVRLNGGIPIHINLTDSFGIDWDLVRARITTSTRMVIINTPHNPSGSILAEADLLELERIAEQHDLLVLSDEVYERLIFDGATHQSVLRFPALANRSFAVFSFGKTFHATGWKMGYVVAPAALTTEIRRTHQFVVFSVNTPIQLAMADYLRDPDHYTTLGSFYQRKRDFFLNEIRGSSFEPIASRGSYFQLLSYRAISRDRDVAMAERLTKEHKVASIPISVFYKDHTDHNILRFCFAKKEETLAKACRILRAL
ncbi:MAG TPA: methionine aminotransferase [Chryseolinea sp.]|nr:methionine aminotransferase [Chryseolinea sp.]